MDCKEALGLFGNEIQEFMDFLGIGGVLSFEHTNGDKTTPLECKNLDN